MAGGHRTGSTPASAGTSVLLVEAALEETLSLAMTLVQKYLTLAP